MTDDQRLDGFGLPAYRQNAPTTPFGFVGDQGYQSDADSGLLLLGNRYYDPSIGRFLSPDPVGDGDNWYAYCQNDPTGATDPTGLSLNASCPYAPHDTGAGFSGYLATSNGYDSPGTSEEERHRTVTTTITTYADGTKWLTETAGPWSDWQPDGYSGDFQLCGGQSRGISFDWDAIGRSMKRYLAVFGILGIGGVSYKPATDTWFNFQNGQTQSQMINNMREQENKYEAGKLSGHATGNTVGGSTEADYARLNQLIQDARKGGIYSAGKAASGAYSTIYQSFGP